ncbi:hypothetical protein LTS17_008236 [Exophiala oligosperma]
MSVVPITPLGHTVINLGIAFGILTFIVISLRLLSRAWCSGRIWVDDDAAVNRGAGQHLDIVLQAGAENLLIYSKIVYVSSIFYNASLGFIKASVLTLYARLGDKQLRLFSFIVLGICVCSATANVLICIFQCAPIKAAWDTSIVSKTCVNINAFYLANAATNIFTDLLTYFLPVRLVMKLQVPRNQKIAVGVMLSLGLLACISSIVRITFLPNMLSSPDPTSVIAKPYYWSIIEINVGVLAASLPSLKPLARRVLPRLLGDTSMKPTYGRENSDRSRGNSFNKLGGGDQNASQTSRDMYAEKRDMKSPTAAHNGRDVEMSYLDTLSARSGDGQAQPRHSHESQEYIVKKADNGQIVRTVEISRSVEAKGGFNSHSTRLHSEVYPGQAC